MNIRKLLAAAGILAALAAPVQAATVPLLTGPQPAADLLSVLNALVVSINTSLGFNPGCVVTASSNAGTCVGLRGEYTTASLSTAHSAAATAQVITDTAVTATSVILCTIDGYSGTFGTNGNPTVACVPTANTITATVVNAADTNALSGTVTIGFAILN